MKLSYLFSKLLKKIRGASILNSSIHPTSKIESGSTVVHSKMDKHSFCGYNCDIIYSEIGSFCSISNNVKIGGGMHPMDWVSTSPVFYKGRDSVKAKFSEFEREPNKIVRIGNDVWIGEGVLIKQGVTIGNGAVIGMGSVVTKDIEPYAIFAGNPAKKIRNRFDEEIINELNQLNWWDLPEDTLREAATLIQNPSEFISKVKSILNK